MTLFNSGLEQANLILQSNVLQSSWQQLSKLKQDVQHPPSSSSKLIHGVSSDDPKWTVITFASSVEPRVVGSDLVLSSEDGKSFDLLAFLREKKRFAVNQAAISLFHENRDQLLRIKDQAIASTKPLIITGHGLWGSVASLFTLWLLDSVDFADRSRECKRRPICITFGSPLIGDANLQQALYKYTPWSSNFLHVVSDRDPVPRMLADDTKKNYKPFGAFLLCSESGCSCFDEPETILKLLALICPSQNQGADYGLVDYGQVVENVKSKSVFKRTFNVNLTNPYQVGTVTQLSAIGLAQNSQPVNQDLTKEIEKLEMKFLIGKRTVKPEKRLNEAKMNLAKLEWYMKSCSDQGVGYYDCYKNMRFMRDMNVQECVKRLMIYWGDLVEEADMKPRADGKRLPTRRLYGGLNYTRIVEPLCIAEHYSPEKVVSGYEETARPKHFRRLVELAADRKIENDAANENRNARRADAANENRNARRADNEEMRKRAIQATVTKDSCFWAKVEQAIISCRKSELEKLKDFEVYVVSLLKTSAVSPDIFLDQSSFMLWWKEYKVLYDEGVMGNNYVSPLNDIMVNGKYKRYCQGEQLN